MLTKKQILEIREHLNKAQNPVFFFDNDPDGLSSFLLLQRFIGRGKGVPIRSFPEMSKDYFRKVEELDVDYIFILDKPLVSKEFFEEVNKVNIPVVWIDHHDFVKDIPEFVHYYNPKTKNKKMGEPVTFLCWQVVQKERKDDLWLAVVGCISDSYMPKFYKDFIKKYPDLGESSSDPFYVFYHSQIGKIIRIFSFGLKDSITNVVIMLKYLMSVKSPYDIFDENSKNKSMYERFNYIDKKYKKFVDKAKELSLSSENKVLFFQYGGDLSISSDISNELIYNFPKKIVVVVYVIGGKANISARGKNVKKIILNAIEGLEGATGGGHEEAVGAKLRVDDLELFRERVEKLV